MSRSGKNFGDGSKTGDGSKFEVPTKLDPSEFKWGVKGSLDSFAPASFGAGKGSSRGPVVQKAQKPPPVDDDDDQDNDEIPGEYDEGDEGDHNAEDYEDAAPGGPGGPAGKFFTPSMPVSGAFAFNNAFPTPSFPPPNFSASGFPTVATPAFSSPSSAPSTTAATAAGSFSFSSPFTSNFSGFATPQFSAPGFSTTSFSTSAFSSSSFTSFSTTSTSSATSGSSTSTTSASFSGFSTTNFPSTSSGFSFGSKTSGTTSTTGFQFPTSSFSQGSTFAPSTSSSFVFSTTSTTNTTSAFPSTPSSFNFAPSTTASSSTTSSTTSGFPSSSTTSSSLSSFTFSSPAKTTTTAPAFSMGSSFNFSTGSAGFSTGTNMFALPTTTTSSTTSSAALFSTPTQSFSFAFNPSRSSGFLAEPNFWKLESEASIFLKNRGFLTPNTPLAPLEAKLQTWLTDAGVSAALIEQHRIAFAKFRAANENQPTKHLFVQDAVRAYKSVEHQKLFILIITYLEQLFQNYHQGLGLIIGFLLLLTDPGTAIAMVVKFHSDEKYAPNLWQAEAVLSATDAYVYWELMAQHIPLVHAHLAKLIQPELYYQKYYCALCVHLLPFEALFNYFGQFAKHGYRAVVTFGLNLVHHLKPFLLRTSEQHIVLELLRLENRDVSDAVCLAIVNESKDWALGDHQWFVNKRKEVYAKYLAKRLPSKKEVAAKTVLCGLCKSVAEWYCEECDCDLCETCMDSGNGGHDQDNHTTYMQDEKPTSKGDAKDVDELTVHTAAISMEAKPAVQASPAKPAEATPVKAAPPIQKAPTPSRPVESKSAAAPAARGGAGALRSQIPTVPKVLQDLDRLFHDKSKLYSDSGIEDDLRGGLTSMVAMNKSFPVARVEHCCQRIKQRAEPRVFSDDEFERASAAVSQFEDYPPLKEALRVIRQFWQVVRTEMLSLFSLLPVLMDAPIALPLLRNLYRKGAKLEKLRLAPAAELAAAKSKLLLAQQHLQRPSRSPEDARSVDAIIANAGQRHS